MWSGDLVVTRCARQGFLSGFYSKQRGELETYSRLPLFAAGQALGALDGEGERTCHSSVPVLARCCVGRGHPCMSGGSLVWRSRSKGLGNTATPPSCSSSV